MIVIFLLTQVFDGAFTYIGVVQFGIGAEANPLVASVMRTFGVAEGLIFAKVLASVLGIIMYLRELHGAVAALSLFYVTIALGPWSAILFW